MSLRFKFLIVIVLMVTFSTAAYLAIAVNIFKNDKTAYVFDNMAALVETLAEEAQTSFQNTWLVMRMAALLHEQAPDQSASESAISALMAANSGVFALSVLQPTGEVEVSFEDRSQLAPYNFTTSEIASLHSLQFVDISELRRDGVSVQLSLFGDRLPMLSMALAVNGADGNLEGIVLAQLGQERRLAVFQRSHTYESFLVDRRGQLLAHSDASQLFLPFSEDLQGSVDQVLSMATGHGVFEQKLHEGLSYLVAYKKLDFAGLAVVTMLPRETAFLATNQLILRSGYLAMAILSVAFLISLVYTKRLTATLHRLVAATRQIATGDFAVALPIRSSDEVGRLAQSFNAMAFEIDRLVRETADKARMEKELETAQLVQDSFFPPNSVSIGHFELSAFYQPASECGGDWWSYFVSDNKLYLLMGDATGHGVPAALLTATAHSCTATIEALSRSSLKLPLSPGWLLSQLNAAIYGAADGRMKMTFFAAAIDLGSGEVCYANAAHPMPYWLKFVNEDQDLGREKIDVLAGRPGNWLGGSPNVVYEEHSLKLEEGETLVWFTDGLTECVNAESIEYGEPRFIRELSKVRLASAQALNDHVMTKINDFRGDAPLSDDITLLILQRRKHTVFERHAS